MSKQCIVGVLCGGQSPEHIISITSARKVVAALNKSTYQIEVVYITEAGEWFLFDSADAFLSSGQDLQKPAMNAGHRVCFSWGGGQSQLLDHATAAVRTNVDVIFPVLHGRHGEDGTIQGLCELAAVPFVGSGTLASAVCMDKCIAKQLLRAANILVADWVEERRHESRHSFDEIVAECGLPFFIKPANAGSSVGISKVSEKAQFDAAVEGAFRYDDKILYEQAILGRELECAVLGNAHPQVTVPGEIVSHNDFYSYEAKYLDAQGASVLVPAELEGSFIEPIKALASRSYQVLCCKGMARVDFFLSEDGQVYVNELNTIPGFTDISMYSKLWDYCDLSYPKLLDQLIDLALE